MFSSCTAQCLLRKKVSHTWKQIFVSSENEKHVKRIFSERVIPSKIRTTTFHCEPNTLKEFWIAHCYSKERPGKTTFYLLGRLDTWGIHITEVQISGHSLFQRGGKVSWVDQLNAFLKQNHSNLIEGYFLQL